MKRQAVLLKILLLLMIMNILVPACCFGGAEAGRDTVSLEGVEPKQVDSVLAKLSDEKVRSLLVEEIAKDIPQDAGTTKASGDIVTIAAGWLDMLIPGKGKEDLDESGRFALVGKIPFDYIETARKIGNGSFGGFIVITALIGGILGLAFLAELFIRRFTADFSKQFQEKGIPEVS